MNIFFLHSDPKLCAEFTCDRHIIKMPIESAQLLSTTCRKYGFDVGYKSCYLNHPCRKWLDEAGENVLWLHNLGIELCKEYTFRYGKTHKTQLVLESLPVSDLSKTIGISTKTTPPLCMPDDCKIISDPVESYRRYYLVHKKHLLKYTKRNTPFWINEKKET